jgi:hypothetical protein
MISAIPLSRIHCFHCYAPRYNDGTYCHRCGEYMESRLVSADRHAQCRGCRSTAVKYIFGLPSCGDEGCREVLRAMVEKEAGRVAREIRTEQRSRAAARKVMEQMTRIGL